MAHAFHQLYYHFVWATHTRYPYIQRDWRAELLKLVHEEAIERGGQPIRHNAMPDHVHLLVRLPPTIAVSQFIGQVKAPSPSGRIATLNLNSNSFGRTAMACFRYGVTRSQRFLYTSTIKNATTHRVACPS